jgi:PAS domain S-box-containing protein
MEKIKLALIEDNATHSRMIEQVFGKKEYAFEIFSFNSFFDFQSNWQPSKTDLIITDHQLPKASSFDVISFVREYCKELPVIVLSATLNDHDAARLIIDYRVNDVILKSDLSRLYLSVLKEIQAKKSMELLQQQAQELKMLSMVAEQTHNGVIVTNANEEIIWVNKSFCKISGYSEQETIGNKPSFLVQGEHTDLATRKRIRRKLNEKVPLSEEILNYNRQGEEYWIKLDITPMFDQGKHTGFVAIQEDITKRIIAQNQIKESEDRLDAAIHGADLGVWDLDLISGRNVVNDRWYSMLGYEEGEIETDLQSFIELVHPICLHKIEQTRKELQNGENTFDLTLQCLHKDGNYRIIRNRGRVVHRDINGEIKRLIGTHLDITNETRLSDELTASLKEKTILLQEIHHRVKNNLAIITGLLHLQSYSTDNNEVRSFYSDMTTRIKTIADVHELLYNSESFTRINLHEYIGSLTTNIKSLFNNGINPAIHIAIDRNFEININQAIPVGLLLNELLTNSMKHAFDGISSPEISLSIYRVDETIFCSYADNGKGLSSVQIGQSKSLGFTLIQTLLQQLESSFEFIDKSGFGIDFSFEVLHTGSHSSLAIAD